MNTTNPTEAQTLPRWYWIATLLGLAWNIFGLFQFITSLNATQESLVAGGLTPEQASVMLGYPMWMTIAFAIGVVGGTLGCVLLVLRRRLALGVFAASLLGYIALWIGDAVHGVFAAMGAPQVVILSIVVVIALGLWLMTRAFAPQLRG